LGSGLPEASCPRQASADRAREAGETLNSRAAGGVLPIARESVESVATGLDRAAASDRARRSALQAVALG